MRYRLLPYIVSLASAVVAVGLPLVKRLVLKFLEKLHCVGCRDAIFIRRGLA